MFSVTKAKEYLEPHVNDFIGFLDSSSNRNISTIDFLILWEKYSANQIALSFEYRVLFLKMVKNAYEKRESPSSSLTLKKVEHV